ncbi:MAG: BamA/TamA family outer membrane protein [Myxococcales bacterium]|nr:BamA/TamA family outer membrane protein [Myxococcales bacterium]
MTFCRIMACLACLLFAGGSAEAATYDPDLKWRTLRTEHFDIHFHQGIEQVADEFSGMVEGVYEDMADELKWELRQRVDVTLIDRTDAANGFATTVPYNSITVFVTAPTEASTLNTYEDWSTTIFTHELTHVLHMETNHGIVRAARAVVGRIASTNDVSPGWIIEGFATFQETRQSTGGRGRASWPAMIKRTAVLEDDFPPLGNLDGFQPTPPSGNLRYLFGQDFIQYVSDHAGRDVWTRWTHTYGSSVPFLLPTKKVFGRRLVPLYYDWKRHLADTYEAQAEAVRREGETIGRLVSDAEASCVAPAFSPDGEKLVWSCVDLNKGSSIWMADDMGFAPEVLLKDFGAAYFTWRADSKAFVYASTHIVNRFNVWSDIYMHTLGGGTTALTSGARARDPDFSPDGSRLLYVTNRAQNNQLQTMTVDRRRQTLTDNSDHTQYSTPRHAPNGQSVALSVWQDGRRDLWIYGVDGAPRRRVTADTAIDADPVWSADGRLLFFSSDRSSIPNIYAVDVQTERLYQITNVVTGAVKPTVHPDGSRIAYMQYSADGWDIRVLELDREQWIDRGLLPRPLRHGMPLAEAVGEPKGPQPKARAQGNGSATESRGIPASEAVAVVDGSVWEEPPETLARKRRAPKKPTLVAMDPFPFQPRQDPDVLDNFQDTEVEDVFGDEQDYPFQLTPRRYNPLRSLPPRYVLPFIRTTPFRPRQPWTFTCVDQVLFCPSLQVSVSSSATDALRRYGWGASLSYRTDANYVGASAAVTINRFLPVYTFAASTRAVAAAQLTFVDPEAPLAEDGSVQVQSTDPPTIYWERRTSASATVSWPYRLRATAFAQYSLTDRQPRFELPDNTYLPNIPLIGRVGTLSGGWRYGWSQPTALAISPEDGRVFSLVGSLLHPWLGTAVKNLETGELEPITQLQVTSETRQYVVMPWLANHVLAGRAAGGVSFGNADFLGNYLLGGAIGDTGFSVVPDSLRMVRGYPLAFDIGDMYWLGSLEYRLPLWHVNRGVGTVPVFARNLSAAVFVDAGNAFNNPSVSTGRPATFPELGRAAVEQPLVGVGAELSWRAIIGWGIGLQGRLGWAVGLTEGGYRPQDGIFPFYAQLGGSF